jgi:hypothetical protein
MYYPIQDLEQLHWERTKALGASLRVAFFREKLKQEQK